MFLLVPARSASYAWPGTTPHRRYPKLRTSRQKNRHIPHHNTNVALFRAGAENRVKVRIFGGKQTSEKLFLISSPIFDMIRLQLQRLCICTLIQPEKGLFFFPLVWLFSRSFPKWIGHFDLTATRRITVKTTTSTSGTPSTLLTFDRNNIVRPSQQ